MLLRYLLQTLPDPSPASNQVNHIEIADFHPSDAVSNKQGIIRQQLAHPRRAAIKAHPRLEGRQGVTFLGRDWVLGILTPRRPALTRPPGEGILTVVVYLCNK